MMDFYNGWLEESNRIEKTVNEAPRVARGKNLTGYALARTARQLS